MSIHSQLGLLFWAPGPWPRWGKPKRCAGDHRTKARVTTGTLARWERSLVTGAASEWARAHHGGRPWGWLREAERAPAPGQSSVVRTCPFTGCPRDKAALPT